MNQSISLPTVSVVIPAHNEAAHISQTLQTLVEQDYKGQLELIVVDSNCTDETAALAQKIGARIVIQTQPGVAAARQAGFLAATGQIITTTDADCRLPHNWISKIVETFQANPQTVAVAGSFTFYDGPIWLRKLADYGMQPLFSLMHWYSGANMAVSRDAFSHVGGFNLQTFVGEDSELGRNLTAIGLVKRVPRLRVQTSARRYTKLGLWGGIWSYGRAHSQQAAKRSPSFDSGSVIESWGFLKKSVVNLTVFALISFFALQVHPVRAQATTEGRYITHRALQILPDTIPEMKEATQTARLKIAKRARLRPQRSSHEPQRKSRLTAARTV